MLQSDGFGPAYRDLARREPVFARLVTVYGRPDPFEWHDGGRTGSCCTLWDSRYQPSQRSRSTTGLARPPAAFSRRPAFSASARTASGPAGCLRPGHATPWLSPKLVDLPQGQPGHPSRAMTEEQASKVLKAAGGQATGFVKVSKDKYAATHAATGSGELACGTWTRLGNPATEIGTDLATTTCRFCRRTRTRRRRGRKPEARSAVRAVDHARTGTSRSSGGTSAVSVPFIHPCWSGSVGL